ncbi:MAG: NAD(P)H-dependent oxidoreductase [Acidimicrobiia bacterium]
MDLALVVVAALSPDGRELRHAQIVRGVLGESRIVETIDLVAEGVTPAMSRTERIRYETDEPIVDSVIAVHADLVARAETMVFIFPTRWWSAPPILKAWMERTFVPGVAFTLDSKRRVRPNLGELRSLAGVTTHERPAAIAAGGDGARRILLRTMRLNAPRRVRNEWLVDADEATIATRIGRL